MYHPRAALTLLWSRMMLNFGFSCLYYSGAVITDTASSPVVLGFAARALCTLGKYCQQPIKP